MFATKNLFFFLFIFFLLVFSIFDVKVQLLKHFFENVKKKKVYGRGILERVGRVTVDTTFFFFALLD